MIRCNNCGTNNLDGSDYCDECGMKLDLVPQSRGRQSFFPPPSAVASEPPPPNTNEGPPIAPPSFTTSTSIPKPAMPARERRNEPRHADAPPPPSGNHAGRRPSATDERAAYN